MMEITYEKLSNLQFEMQCWHSDSNWVRHRCHETVIQSCLVELRKDEFYIKFIGVIEGGYEQNLKDFDIFIYEDDERPRGCPFEINFTIIDDFNKKLSQKHTTKALFALFDSRVPKAKCPAPWPKMLRVALKNKGWEYLGHYLSSDPKQVIWTD